MGDSILTPDTSAVTPNTPDQAAALARVYQRLTDLQRQIDALGRQPAPLSQRLTVLWSYGSYTAPITATAQKKYAASKTLVIVSFSVNSDVSASPQSPTLLVSVNGTSRLNWSGYNPGWSQVTSYTAPTLIYDASNEPAGTLSVTVDRSNVTNTTIRGSGIVLDFFSDT